MTRKERQHKRALDNGEVYIAPRKISMPSPKVIQLKHKLKKEKAILNSWKGNY